MTEIFRRPRLQIGPAKALPVKVLAFGVDATLGEDVPNLRADALIEISAHSPALADISHENRLQLIVSLPHLIRRVAFLLHSSKSNQSVRVLGNEQDFLKLDASLASHVEALAVAEVTSKNS